MKSWWKTIRKWKEQGWEVLADLSGDILHLEIHRDCPYCGDDLYCGYVIYNVSTGEMVEWGYGE